MSSTGGGTSCLARVWQRVWMLSFFVRQARRGMLDQGTYTLRY